MTRGISWFLAGSTLPALLAPYIHPADFWPVALFGLLTPWFLLANFLLLLVFAYRKDPYFLVPLGVLILAWPAIDSILGLWPGGKVTPREKELIVTTLNAHGMQDFEQVGHGLIDPGELSRYPVLNNADVLFLQEFPFSPNAEKPFLQFFRNHPRYKHFIRDHNRSLLIASIYPLKKVQATYFANRSNGYLICDITIGKDTYRLANLHLQSNAVSDLADEVSEHGQLQDKETWLNLRGMINRYRETVVTRAYQAEEIVAYLEKSPYPVILGGDFNEGPHSFAYRVLAAGRTDSFRERGFGSGVTYSGKVPGLRIDYILSDPALEILLTSHTRIPFSDHRAVNSVLALP